MELDLKELFELVAQMNSKLLKLDNIERYMVCVDQEIKYLKQSYVHFWRRSGQRGK